jgi:23S rRNA (uridine2552-2'-O)-methyltransferase
MKVFICYSNIPRGVYTKKDASYREAKAQGYRARSALKLKQIHNKFKIIKKGTIVIDIGASPGGWTQVAAEKVGPEGMVIAVDIVDMEPLEAPNIIFIKGDVTDPKTIEKLLEHAGSVGSVISDIAPKTTGIADLDRSRSAILSSMALDVAVKTLRPGGIFLTKVFQSPESEELFLEMKSMFSYVKRFRPPSTRKRSVEIYLIGKGFHPQGAGQYLEEEPEF